MFILEGHILYYSYSYFTPAGHSSSRWAYVHGLCEKAIYGGRITNTQDIAILTTYLRCTFTSDNVNWKDGIPGIMDLNSGDSKVKNHGIRLKTNARLGWAVFVNQLC